MLPADHVEVKITALITESRTLIRARLAAIAHGDAPAPLPPPRSRGSSLETNMLIAREPAT